MTEKLVCAAAAVLLFAAPALGAPPPAARTPAVAAAAKVLSGAAPSEKKVPPAAASAVAPSTAAATVESLYTASRLRDPFDIPGSVALAKKPFTPQDFSIHSLVLGGVVLGAGGDLALFSDPDFGVSFVLREGRLYDQKNKPLPGVVGAVDRERKRVKLIGPGQDMQVFSFGEGGGRK